MCGGCHCASALVDQGIFLVYVCRFFALYDVTLTSLVARWVASKPILGPSSTDSAAAGQQNYNEAAYQPSYNNPQY